MPFRTVYGISIRIIAQHQSMDFSETIPNIVIFGRSVGEGVV